MRTFGSAFFHYDAKTMWLESPSQAAEFISSHPGKPELANTNQSGLRSFLRTEGVKACATEKLERCLPAIQIVDARPTEKQILPIDSKISARLVADLFWAGVCIDFSDSSNCSFSPSRARLESRGNQRKMDGHFLLQ